MKNTVRVYSIADDADTLITPHFKVKEFACKDGAVPVFVDSDLLWLLEGVRMHYGAPVIINSGYRTPSYNAKVGGKAHSMHLFGMAADIVVKGVSPAKVYAYLNGAFPNSLGLGKYDSFTHVDVRETKARW